MNSNVEFDIPAEPLTCDQWAQRKSPRRVRRDLATHGGAGQGRGARQQRGGRDISDNEATQGQDGHEDVSGFGLQHSSCSSLRIRSESCHTMPPLLSQAASKYVEEDREGL